MLVNALIGPSILQQRVEHRRDVEGVALLRPLLDMSRDETRKACAAMGLEPWEDPHNLDPSYARSRVRGSALPALVEALDSDFLLIKPDAAVATEHVPRRSRTHRSGEALPPAARSAARHAWVGGVPVNRSS